MSYDATVLEDPETEALETAGGIGGAWEQVPAEHIRAVAGF